MAAPKTFAYWDAINYDALAEDSENPISSENNNIKVLYDKVVAQTEQAAKNILISRLKEKRLKKNTGKTPVELDCKYRKLSQLLKTFFASYSSGTELLKVPGQEKAAIDHLVEALEATNEISKVDINEAEISAQLKELLSMITISCLGIAGRKLFELKEYSKSFDCLKILLLEDSKSIDAWLMTSQIFILFKNPLAAKLHLDQLSNLLKTVANNNLDLKKEIDQLNDANSKLFANSNDISDDFTNLSADELFRRGVIFAEEGFYKSGLHHSLEAAKKQSENNQLEKLSLLNAIFCSLNLNDEATWLSGLELCHKFSGKIGDSSILLLYRGKLLSKLCRYKEALKDFILCQELAQSHSSCVEKSNEIVEFEEATTSGNETVDQTISSEVKVLEIDCITAKIIEKRMNLPYDYHCLRIDRSSLVRVIDVEAVTEYFSERLGREISETKHFVEVVGM